MSVATIAVAPCAVCRSEGGLSRAKDGTPARLSGRRFGIPEALCLTCYNRLDRRRMVGQPLAPGTPRLPPRRQPAPPCVACGTLRGFVPKDHRRPARYRGTRLGLDGWLCCACYFRRKNRRQKGLPLDGPIPRLTRPDGYWKAHVPAVLAACRELGTRGIYPSRDLLKLACPGAPMYAIERSVEHLVGTGRLKLLRVLYPKRDLGRTEPTPLGRAYLDARAALERLARANTNGKARE